MVTMRPYDRFMSQLAFPLLASLLTGNIWSQIGESVESNENEWKERVDDWVKGTEIRCSTLLDFNSKDQHRRLSFCYWHTKFIHQIDQITDCVVAFQSARLWRRACRDCSGRSRAPPPATSSPCATPWSSRMLRQDGTPGMPFSILLTMFTILSQKVRTRLRELTPPPTAKRSREAILRYLIFTFFCRVLCARTYDRVDVPKVK